METQNIDQIFDEIRQLRIQYESEVGRARKAWPKSIRERIARLATCGIRYKAIAERSGLSKNTIYSWMKRQDEPSLPNLPVPATFIELPVVAPKPSVRRNRKPVHPKTTTVTVKIGERVLVSGLSASEALHMIQSLGI